MTSLTTVAEFSGLQIQIHDLKGARWVAMRDIGRALGYTDPENIKKVYQRHTDEFGPLDTCIANSAGFGDKLSPPLGGHQQVRLFSQSGAVLLSMFANTQRAKDFRAWAKRVLVAELDRQHAGAAAAPAPASVDGRLASIETTMASLAHNMDQLVRVSTQQAVKYEVMGKYVAALEMNQRGQIRITPEIEQEVFALHAQGMSQPAIGRLLRISTAAVNRLLKGTYPRNSALAATPTPAALVDEAAQRIAAAEAERILARGAA